ncbi:MAG: ABC transporter permease [Eubacterium sp.]|nr:ABC transporter permease [Eubacterium sp.]
MNSKLLLRLIKSSMDKCRHIRIPFLLVGIINVTVFYILSTLVYGDALIKDGIEVFYGAETVDMVLMIGCIVVAIISIIVILYANAFVMKDRRREIGLYGILGLSKKSIVTMLFYETIIHLIICLGGGLLIGTFLNKLMVLILYKLAGQPPVNGFVFSENALLLTIVLFLIVYGICFIYNVLGIKISKPVELLRSKSAGEKEPKSKIITLAIGIITIVAGYYVAINCDSTFDTFTMLFSSIGLVIIATYCLFIAGTIAILKAIKKNRKMYYKTSNFIGVANLMYRMKHNAVGLASICVLSTAVIILISCIASLVALSENTLNSIYPSDVMVKYVSEDDTVSEKFESLVEELDGYDLEKVETRDLWNVEWIHRSEDQTGKFLKLSDLEDYEFDNIKNVYIITQDTYNRYAKDSINLEKGQVCIADSDNNKYDFVSCEDINYKASDDKLDQNVMAPFKDASMSLFTSIYIIVPDDETGFEIRNNTTDSNMIQGNENCKIYISSFDINGNLTEKEINTIKNKLSAISDNCDISIRQEDEQFFKNLYGGILFVGMFLLIIFAIVTVLIIYYKQMSEGYEDNGRYQILKKVGLTEKETKASINRQVMIMFFLPIVVASIHAIVASNIIRLFMKMILYVDAFTFNMAVLGSIVFFAVIYCIVYKLTSRQYYKIVSFNN